MAGDLDELAGMEAADGKEALVAALERAVAFGRFRATTCAASWPPAPAWARPTAPGEALVLALPTVPTRPLGDYAIIGQERP